MNGGRRRRREDLRPAVRRRHDQQRDAADGGPAHVGDVATPPTRRAVQDVFFRIGGASAGKATTSLIVNSNNAIVDDIWSWRADHGNAATGWTINTADTGLIVNGANVLATGLFVEHYQKYQVIWNGENGKTIFFQNEMPYDVPSQAAWTSGNGNGWAAYKVGDERARPTEACGPGQLLLLQHRRHEHQHQRVARVRGARRRRREAARPADRVPRRQRHDQPRRQQHGHRRRGRRRSPVDEVSYP